MGTSAASTKDGPAADPNIVPLIDMFLVLIIIFMVITPRIPTGLPALIPQPQSAPEARSIVVQVMPGGKILINQEPSDWDALGSRLTDIFKTRADKVTFVKGAEDVPFAEMARAIDIMRGVGVDHVGLITPTIAAAE